MKRWAFVRLMTKTDIHLTIDFWLGCRSLSHLLTYRLTILVHDGQRAQLIRLTTIAATLARWLIPTLGPSSKMAHLLPCPIPEDTFKSFVFFEAQWYQWQILKTPRDLLNLGPLRWSVSRWFAQLEEPTTTKKMDWIKKGVRNRRSANWLQWDKKASFDPCWGLQLNNDRPLQDHRALKCELPSIDNGSWTKRLSTVHLFFLCPNLTKASLVMKPGRGHGVRCRIAIPEYTNESVPSGAMINEYFLTKERKNRWQWMKQWQTFERAIPETHHLKYPALNWTWKDCSITFFSFYFSYVVLYSPLAGCQYISHLLIGPFFVVSSRGFHTRATAVSSCIRSAVV